MNTTNLLKKTAAACLVALTASVTLVGVTSPVQAATTTFGKTVNFTFEPDSAYNNTVVKISPVQGANSYTVFYSTKNVGTGRNVYVTKQAKRMCGFGWTKCHWFATIPMPKDWSSKVTVMAAVESGGRMYRVGVTSTSLSNPTDVKVALNVAESLGWHDARNYTPPAVTSAPVRQYMREYYKCKRWAPRAVSLLLVSQAALHDPEDLKGAYDLVTAADLSPAALRAFLGTSTTGGMCERAHIQRAIGGAYLSKSIAKNASAAR